LEILTLDDLARATPDEIRDVTSRLSIVPDLRRYVEWLVTEGPDVTVDSTFARRNRSKGIHPSTISHVGFCPLRAYYECTGELEAAPVIDFDTILTFDIGTLLHNLFQTHLKAMFEDQFQDEVKLRYDPFHIKGSADGLFTFPFARAVLEIKSIKEGGGSGWDRVQDRPLPDHPRQIMCYQKALDAPFGIILYICKNNSGLKEHIFPFSHEVWQSIEEEAKPVVQAVYENGPMVLPKPGGNCYICPFSTSCKHSTKRSKSERTSSRSIKPIRL